jgi:hypothetical protein
MSGAAMTTRTDAEPLTDEVVAAAIALITSDGWETHTPASDEAAQRLIRALAALSAEPREVGLPPPDLSLIGTEYKPLLRKRLR